MKAPLMIHPLGSVRPDFSIRALPHAIPTSKANTLVGVSAAAVRFGATPKSLTTFLWSILCLSGGLVTSIPTVIGFLKGDTLLQDNQIPFVQTLSEVEKARYQAGTEQLLNSPNIKFKCFGFAPDGIHFTPVAENMYFRAIKTTICERFSEVLLNRPDLLESLQAEPWEISLYPCESYHHSKFGHLHIAGTCDNLGNLTYAADSLTPALDRLDGYEVVGHEFGHKLDTMGLNGKSLKVTDGLLPGWTPAQIEQYTKARAVEKTKMGFWGSSPIRSYGLGNDQEFLAVLVETYLEKPEALQKSNPELHGLMHDYFQHKLELTGTQSPTSTCLFLGSTILLMTAAGIGLFRTHRALNQELQQAHTKAMEEIF